jgi:hypothetical protein
MTSLEQRRKPYGRHEGQDHGTRGTNRDKVAVDKVLRTVQLDPEFSDDPAKQKRMFKVDLANMRWSISYDKERNEAARDEVTHHEHATAHQDIEQGMEEYIDPVTPETFPVTNTDKAESAIHTTGKFKKPKANKQFSKRIRQIEKNKREDENDQVHLSRLYRTLAGLIKELNNTPRTSFPESWVSQADLDRRVDELEGEIESIKEEIEELEEGGNTTIPYATDAEMGLMTEKQREEYLQRKHGDMESDDEDDHGLDSLDNGIRAHKLPKKTWY